MPSDKCYLITANTTFSLLEVASAQQVHSGIPQYTQCMLHGLTCVLLCVKFIFTDSKRCHFEVMLHDDFPTFVVGTARVSIVAGLITHGVLHLNYCIPD